MEKYAFSAVIWIELIAKIFYYVPMCIYAGSVWIEMKAARENV